MKTEKRLTMALSVLVALMMLAVPLASSSNLFVDGGQTNSNGDAPSLGAAGDTGFNVIFQLNGDGKSLDQVSEDDLDTLITNLNGKGTSAPNNAPAVAGATWYKNENGDLAALVTYNKDTPDANVHIQTLINALFATDAANVVSKITKGSAYTLTSWNDIKSNLSYEYAAITGDDSSAVINSDMTFAAQWELDEEKYVEVPVNVVVDGETKEYYKAYELKGANSNQVEIDKGALNQAILDAADLNLFGIVIFNMESVVYTQVYKNGAVTYGNGSDIPDNNLISSKSTLTITYTFDDKKYSKLTVSSAALEEDAILFIDKSTASLLVYSSILDALTTGFIEESSNVYTPIQQGETDFGNAKIKPLILLDSNSYTNDSTTSDFSYEFDEDGNLLTDGGYLLSGWNSGAELLTSMNLVSGTTQVTLDAELNGYYVIFMSKGAYEIVYVPFGELSADLLKTLDVAGVNHWAYIEYTSYENFSSSTTFTTFTSFTDSVKEKFDGFGKNAIAADTQKQPVAILVACFDFASKTSYAAFDAVNGNYGNKYVDKIIVSGTCSTDSTNNLIPLPAVSPVYEDEVVFINYVTADSNKVPYATGGYGAAYFNKVADKDTIIVYDADVVTYTYTITFYNGSDVVGTFYYDNDLNGSAADMKSGLKAFTYKGVSYKLGDLTAPTEPAANADADVKAKYEADKDRYDAATKAYNSILYTAKAGYEISQWKDADGNLMLDKVDKDDKTYEVKFDKIKADASFYAAFDAEDYLIAYNGNTATATNNMPQIGTVDSAVNLFSDAAFSNDGYKLKEWNTRPDGKGTSYALGASFTLTGEQYEDLKGVPTGDGLPSDGSYEKGFTLYAIWEKSSSGSGSGDNNEGNDGNNTDTYLLAGILAVIIILIILIAFLMRRKN